MRLRTFESFWLLKNGLMYTYPSLQKDIATEIIVVGGGITGALISHALLNEGYHVTILDKRDIAQGSTSATTSMLQYEIDVPLYNLAKMIGEEAAATCYKAGIKAVKDLETLVVTEQIDCGFVTKKSLYYAHDKKAVNWLREEFEIRKKYKLGVQWLDADNIKNKYGLQTYGGILSDTAASMDAYQFAHELIHKNTKRGLQVYDQTAIKEFQFGKSQNTVYLKNGHKAVCSKIVFCSGFETVDLLKEKTATLLSTFASVSERQINVLPALHDILIWNTDDPYLYMRTTDDGRLLVGGEDSSHNSGIFREKTKEKKSDTLVKKLEKILPDVQFTEDFSWAGVFGTTKDGLPYIGGHPKQPNAYYVLGFGGNGITFSVQAMDLIVKLLKNEQDVLLDYYRFDR